MIRIKKNVIIISILLVSIIACSKTDTITSSASNLVFTDPYAQIKATFGNNIDLANLLNYAGQSKPSYITKDNGISNPITNSKATLGRVLFYDKNLSIDNTISCASCHHQKFAFGDTAIRSNGIQNGLTIRHAMRLVNTRFSEEVRYFWNERAATLEQQTTIPIQDHSEMGFSGLNGRGNLNTLLTKISGIGYYKELFKFIYGDTVVTENRLQETLSQFLRSIQSFDSKYDMGRAQVNGDNRPFPNFTAEENTGKNLFLTAPVFDANSVRIAGGVGCNGCHRAPEFDIDSASRSNGIIGVIGSTALDIGNTKSPSLRDLINTNGTPNTPMMHTGQFTTIQAVLGHYNSITLGRNNNIDPKLRPNNIGQQLNMTPDEVSAIIAFMKTLTGTSIYTDKKWSDPFSK